MEQSLEHTESGSGCHEEVETWLKTIFQAITEKLAGSRSITQGELENIIIEKTDSRTLENIAYAICNRPVSEMASNEQTTNEEIIAFCKIVITPIQDAFETNGIMTSIPRLTQKIVKSLQHRFRPVYSLRDKDIKVPHGGSAHSITLELLRNIAGRRAEDLIYNYDTWLAERRRNDSITPLPSPPLAQ